MAFIVLLQCFVISSIFLSWLGVCPLYARHHGIGKQFVGLKKYIDNEMWRNILLNAKKITYTNPMRLHTRLFRLHVTPAIRCKYDPMCSPLCLKCKKKAVAYSYLTWSCPKIVIFWLSKSTATLRKYLG